MNRSSPPAARLRGRAGWAALALLCALAACGGSDDDDDDRPPGNANPNGALTEAQINAAQAALDRPLEVDTPADPGMIDAAQIALDDVETEL